MHGEAQTPLGRLVDDILYNKVGNKFTTNRTDGARVLVHSITGVYRVNNTGPSSTAILSSVNGVPWRNFPESTVAHANNGSREPNHAPLSFRWQDLI